VKNKNSSKNIPRAKISHGEIKRQFRSIVPQSHKNLISTLSRDTIRKFSISQ